MGLRLSRFFGSELNRYRSQCHIRDDAIFPASASATFLFVFFAFPSILYVFSMFLFWLSIPLGNFHIFAAIAICTGICLKMNRRPKGETPWMITFQSILALFIWLACLAWLHSFFFDSSYDGRTYHASAIQQLSLGWNPVYERLLPDKWGIGENHTIWLNTMPKFPWVFAACIYKLTGSIASSKLLCLYYVLPIFILLFLELRKRVGYFVATVIAGALIANPVAGMQFFTNYIDGIGYFLFVVFLIYGFKLTQDRRHWSSCPIFLLYSIALAATKLTILFPTVIALICFLVFSKIRSILWNKYILIFILISLLSLYTPYISNFLYYGSPLYPMRNNQIMNKSHFPDNFAPADGMAEVIEAANRPYFNSPSRSGRFFESLFSYSSNDLGQQRLKFPFVVRKREWTTFTYSDVRTGGFGPLFSGTYICALIIAVLGFCLKRKREYLIVPIVGIGMSILAIVTPGSWWARYVSYIWLVPFFFITPAMVSREGKLFFCACITSLLLFINGTIILFYNLEFQYKYSMNAAGMYKKYVENNERLQYDGPFIGDELLFHEYGVKYYCLYIDSYRLAHSGDDIKSFYNDIVPVDFANTGKFAKVPSGFFVTKSMLKEGIPSERYPVLVEYFTRPYVIPKDRVNIPDRLGHVGRCLIWLCVSH